MGINDFCKELRRKRQAKRIHRKTKKELIKYRKSFDLIYSYEDRNYLKSLDDENLKLLIDRRGNSLQRYIKYDIRVERELEKYRNVFELLDDASLKRLVKYGSLTFHQYMAISDVFAKRGFYYDSYKEATKNILKTIRIDTYVRHKTWFKMQIFFQKGLERQCQN